MEAAIAHISTGGGVLELGHPLDRLRSDERLVERFRAGDEDAFARLYDRHRPRVFAICMGVLGSREDALDATQEVFASLAAKLPEAAPGDLRAWLARVARNAAIDIVRRRRPEVELAEDEVPLREPSPYRRLVQREELRQVLAGLRELPERQRSALVMREMAGLSYREIGSTLGVDEDAVRGLLSRARISLRSREESRELACSAVRERLAAERDGRRRPGELRRHLRACPGCREFRAALGDETRVLRALAPFGGVGIWKLLLAARLPRYAALGGGLAQPGLAGQAAKVAVVCALAAGTAEGVREAGIAPAGPGRPAGRAARAGDAAAAPSAAQGSAGRPAAGRFRAQVPRRTAPGPARRLSEHRAWSISGGAEQPPSWSPRHDPRPYPPDPRPYPPSDPHQPPSAAPPSFNAPEARPPDAQAPYQPPQPPQDFGSQRPSYQAQSGSPPPDWSQSPPSWEETPRPEPPSDYQRLQQPPAYQPPGGYDYRPPVDYQAPYE